MALDLFRGQELFSRLDGRPLGLIDPQHAIGISFKDLLIDIFWALIWYTGCGDTYTA